MVSRCKGFNVAAVRLIPRFYEERDFELAWTREKNVDTLVQLVANKTKHGLQPEDYHFSALRRILEDVRSTPDPDPSLLVDLDILLTDSLIRLAYHYSFGNVVPSDLDPNWNFGRRLRYEDPVQVLGAAIASESVEKLINEAIPEPYFYRRLRKALIDDALNYKAVAKRLIQFVEESEFQLVETLAERIAEIILDEFSVDWLRLKLGKPGAVTARRRLESLSNVARNPGGQNLYQPGQQH
jgi:murein L,D-transpeptidase YcbB/YkuD